QGNGGGIASRPLRQRGRNCGRHRLSRLGAGELRHRNHDSNRRRLGEGDTVMVHFVIQWDLPDQKANLTIYSNKARNDWLPTTLMHKGVIEIRNYRNPLEVTPHVAITIDFETLDNWRDFIDSQDYIRIMRELRILGCNNFTVNVWAPSKYFPESMRPEKK